MTLIDCQTVSEALDTSDQQRSSWEAITAPWTASEAARLGHRLLAAFQGHGSVGLP